MWVQIYENLHFLQKKRETDVSLSVLGTVVLVWSYDMVKIELIA